MWTLVVIKSDANKVPGGCSTPFFFNKFDNVNISLAFKLRENSENAPWCQKLKHGFLGTLEVELQNGPPNTERKQLAAALHMGRQGRL